MVIACVKKIFKQLLIPLTHRRGKKKRFSHQSHNTNALQRGGFDSAMLRHFFYGLIWVYFAPSIVGVSKVNRFQYFDSIASMEAFYNCTFPLTNVFRDYGPKTLDYIRYLHIPKTGTSFAATMIHYGCHNLKDTYVDVMIRLPSNIPMPWMADPSCKQFLKQPISKNGNWFSHVPYRQDLDKNIVVSMFREPIERLVSQLIHMKSLLGMMVTFGISNDDAIAIQGIMTSNYEPSFNRFYENNMRIRVKQEFLEFNELIIPFIKQLRICETYQNTTSNDLAFCKMKAIALYPGILGCQTKMILGIECAKMYVITMNDIIEAKRRISQEFAFVGIQSRWNQTIHLFHSLYGGKMYEEELLKLRSNKKQKLHQALRGAFVDIIDYADSEIYKHSLEIFDSQINALGIK